MTDAEVLAILNFLEETRSPAVSGLGIEANDPIWLMTIVLLRSHYQNRRITISSLASAAQIPYTTALRHIDKMAEKGLVVRVREEAEPKLVFMEPTDTLLHNFFNYGMHLKNRIGAALGSRSKPIGDFVFGGAHLAARIISEPPKLAQPPRIVPPIRMLIKDDPTFQSLESLIPNISAFLGIKVDCEMLGYDALHERTLANAQNDASAYDIVATDMPWIGRLSHDRTILPLDRLVKKSAINPFDFFAAAWAGGRYQGAQMGIPFAPTAELFLYRTDLFERYDLAEPLTMEGVLTAARRLHGAEPGLSGIAWNAARGQPLGQTFIQVMAAFGSPPVNLQRRRAGFDLDTPIEVLHPTLDHEPGWRTLDYLRQLASISAPEIPVMDWNARISAYRSGAVAMSYEWSSRTAHFESDVTSPARGTTGYLPHPTPKGAASLSPIGGFLLTIPANLEEERIDAAWQTICWLTSPEFTKVLIRHGSPSNFRHSVSADPEVRLQYPVLPVLELMEKRGQLQLWPRPPIPNMTTLMRVVGEEVHDALWGGLPDRKALSRAEERLAPLFAKFSGTETE